MIHAFLICDSEGYPFYSRYYKEELKKYDDSLLSSLISAIGVVGRQIFHEEIATVTFGSGKEIYYMAVITKEMFAQDKMIYFVYFMEGECDRVLIRKIATTIYIETKRVFKTTSIVKQNIREKVDSILDTKFKDLMYCSD